MKKPFYHLDYSSGECLFKIFLNEILIVDNINGLKSPAGNFLLNMYIYNAGEQRIRFEVYPKKNQEEFSKDAFIEIYLFGADQSNNFQDKIDLIPRGTKIPSTLLNIEGKSLPSPVSWDLKFIAENPYIIKNDWKDSKEITSISNYENLVIATYTQIFQLAKEGNAGSLYDLMKSSFNRTNIAYYEKSSGISTTINFFEKLIKQQNIDGDLYALQNLEFGKVRIYGNNKVADVLRPDGNPILYYKKDEKDESGISIDLRLFCPEGNSNVIFKII